MKNSNPFARFFGVLFRSQTYLNLIYLLLVFPLSLVYFLFFTVGASLGLALVFILVGFFILAFLCLTWWAVAVFERYLAIWLLNADIPPMEKPGAKREGTFGWVLDWLENPVTWKSLVYILIRFPLGIFVFIVLVAFGATSVGLISAPLVYWWVPLEVSVSRNINWAIDTFPEALIAFLVGVLLGFISLHVFNFMAYALRLFAEMMLGNPVAVPGASKPELPLQPVEPVSSLKVTAPLASAPAAAEIVTAPEVVETAELPSEGAGEQALAATGDTSTGEKDFIEAGFESGIPPEDTVSPDEDEEPIL